MTVKGLSTLTSAVVMGRCPANTHIPPVGGQHMLIIDGDYPMAYGTIQMQRDLTLPIDQVRTRKKEAQVDTAWLDGGTMASLPEMRNARVAVALVKIVSCIRRPGHPHGDVDTDVHAYAAGQGQLGYYRILEATGESRILESRGEFSDHMKTWLEAIAYDDLPVGMVLGMEGADPITWPKQVHEWYGNGLRVISLSHYRREQVLSRDRHWDRRRPDARREGATSRDGLSRK